MYRIAVACIALMALFLGLFAVSVEPEAGDFGVHGLQDKLTVGSEHAGLRQDTLQHR